MKKLAIGMMVFCSVMTLSVAAWCGDNGNGTVTIGNLVVLKDAGCLGTMNWNDAMARPKNLAHGQCGLTDNSKAGDWRLPDIFELQSMYAQKSQFKNVRAFYYWSSSTYGGGMAGAWDVSMGSGVVLKGPKGISHYVWPVRGGQ